MKKVLLTNFSMTYYTGSELDTVAVAKYFLDHNYEVSIFTIEYGYPLLKDLDERVKLYDYSSIDSICQHFDLIWAHHYPLLDYLLLSKNISADYVYYISLSSYMGYEAFPIYYKELNYLGILSKEALDLAAKEGYETENIHLFTNYSFQKYFNRKVKLNKQVENVCIVSNHIPEEIMELEEIFSSNNINVDIYGIGHQYTKINEKLLSKYDLIISIGKTINYGVSLGIPCYCYDRFGGDGYINLDNIEKSFEYNFSGRYLKNKKSSHEIYEDIIKNYKKIVKEVNKLKNWAHENFCFEKMMESTLEKIYSSKKFDIDEVLRKYPTEIRRSSLFLDTVGSKNEIIKQYEYPLEFCQIYYDFGEGFSEQNSKRLHYKRLNHNDYSVRIKVPNGVQRIRFDYSEKVFTKLNSLEINKKIMPLDELIHVINYNNKCLSINNDPAIIIVPEEKVLEIKVNMEFLDSEEVVNEFTADIHSLRMFIQELDEKRLKNRIKSAFNRTVKK